MIYDFNIIIHIFIMLTHLYHPIEIVMYNQLVKEARKEYDRGEVKRGTVDVLMLDLDQ